jgi:hypothetical protein
VTAEAVRSSQLSDEQIETLLAIASAADSVELKLTVPEAEHRAATIALDVDPLDSQIRQVFFFDTPDLRLNQAGIVVRARRVQGRGDDTVVKLRPVMPEAMPEELRKSPNLVVELDAMPGGFVCSASMKGVPKKTTVRDVVNGTGGTIRQLFSKEQRAFYADHLQDAPDLNELTLLGPISVFKVNLRPKELEHKLVGEMWLYPDYSRIIELSTKCLPQDTLRVAFETRRYLEKRGIHIGGDQQTKTKTALEFFTSHPGA